MQVFFFGIILGLKLGLGYGAIVGAVVFTLRFNRFMLEMSHTVNTQKQEKK